MARLSKKSATVLIIIVCIGIILALKYTVYDVSFSQNKAVKARIKGDPQAEVKIVEYIDFQCPACAYGAKRLNEYMQRYPQRIYLQLYYFPLAMHKHAVTASIFAECAARQEKFWPYHDILIEKQDQWKTLPNAREAFEEMARDIGLDMEDMQTCVADPQIEEYIFKNKEKGRERGVKSTPTYFINGEMAVGARALIQQLNQLNKNGS